MKTLKALFNLLLVVIIGIPLLIILIPVLLFFIPIQYVKNKRFKREYAKFLSENNGKNYFCYNNRKDSQNFIEEHIISSLSDQIEIIHLNHKLPKSYSNAEFISKALYELKDYTKFPHLMKIRNNEILDKSINNSFYNVMNLGKPKTDLFELINNYFELNEKL